MARNKWVVIATISLDSGTERVSADRVRVISSPPATPQMVYEARCLSFGTIDKSIPCPVGMPAISDATIRLADHDRKLRDLLAHQTPRRRIVEIRLMPASASIASYDPVFSGEIVDAEFSGAEVTLSLRDRLYAWLDEPIPAMVIREIYPYTQPPEEGGFLPIVTGVMRSPVTSPSTAKGVVPLPYMGQVGYGSPLAYYDRWGVAMHPIYDLVTVYRKEVVDSVEQWLVVDPAEYTWGIGNDFFENDDNAPFGFEMIPTYLDFYAIQPQGTQIRADIDGIKYRGQWGPLAVEGVLALEDGSELLTEDGEAIEIEGYGPLRNPIDFFINMTYFILHKAGVSTSVFDTAEIASIREQFETMLGSPATPYLCDGAITVPLTAREFLGQFLTSFNLDMFAKRNGKITLAFTSDEDPDRPVLKEGKHILRESFIERLPEHIANFVQVRYEYNNAEGSFGTVQGVDVLDGQYALSVPPNPYFPDEFRDPKIEKEVLDLYFVRDEDTALDVMTRRNTFLSMGSFRQEFKLPAPAVIDELELARLMGLTHSMGLDWWICERGN